MKYSLMIICLAAMVALAGCGGGGGGSTATPSSTTKQAITASAGGTITAAVGTGNMTVTIPASALATDTTIEVTPLTAAPTQLPYSNTFIVGATMGPDGTTFTTPVTVTFPLGTTKTAGTKLLVMLYDATASPTMSPATAATVDAGGTTASFTVSHFSTYVLTGSSTLPATGPSDTPMGFLFASGTQTTQAPFDFYFDLTTAGSPKIQPNHSPMKTTTADYASITEATAGGYDNQSGIAIQAGTVLLVQGLVPGDTNYYKMIVTSLTTTSVSFLYEAITAPPDITGEWNIGTAGTVSIMTGGAIAGGYVVDVHDSGGNLVKLADGTLSGNILTCTWTYADGSTGGPLTITFNSTFTGFTATYQGAENGTWTGTK